MRPGHCAEHFKVDNVDVFDQVRIGGGNSETSETNMFSLYDV